MAGSEIRVRRAKPWEASVLTRITVASKRYWGYPEELLRLWESELTLAPSYIEKNEVYTALRGGEPVAVFALVDHDGVEWELEHLWIDPAHIGGGIGALLFREAVRLARAGGAKSLRIVSDPNAEGFYLRMGAARVGSVASRPEGRRLPVLRFAIGDPATRTAARKGPSDSR